jgi:O-antigen/teichoic acid export membrane protein
MVEEHGGPASGERVDIMSGTGFLTACGWIAFTAAPVVTGLVIVAPDWVRVLYGPKWVETIPLIRMLAPAAFAMLLARPVTAWLQAGGHEAWPARVQIATLPLFAAALVVTVPRGIRAVAAGMAAVLILQSALLVAAALRAGAARWTSWLRALWSGLLPSLIMAAVLWPAAGWFGHAHVAVRLGALVGIGVAVFVGASALFARERWRELVALLRQGRRRS